MRHGFFIICFIANKTPPVRDTALMADMCGGSLLLVSVCNEDKSDYTRLIVTL